MPNDRPTSRVDLDEGTRYVLEAIQSYWEFYGWFPSVREIAPFTPFTSSSTVHRYMMELAAKGYLETYGPQHRYRLTERS